MYAMASYNGSYVLLQQCEKDTLAKDTEKQSKESMTAVWYDSWQLKYAVNRDEEITQWLRKMVTLPQDLSLITSTM